MREGRPSITASCVAFARAAASAAPMTTAVLDDPVARRLFPWPNGLVWQSIARALSFGLVDHIALRTAAIDEAISGGYAQLVLLGAGLDARAYRLRSVANGRVFEVDHPASQRLKLEYARGLEPSARAIEYVAADFLHDDIDTLLAKAGHDAKVATAWIIEGVAMYLPVAVTTRLLDVVSARSAPGSILALTYIHASRRAIARRVGGVFLGALGEPFREAFSRADITERIRAAGLDVESDTNDVDWSKRFGASSRLARFFHDERLVLARRSR
jgi:methyltransferase (TIGR00027 family)